MLGFLRKHLATVIVATVVGMVAAGGASIAHNNPSAGHVKFAHKAGKANSVKGMQVLRLRKVSPSATNAVESTARTNASSVRLLAQGPFVVYAKCFKSTADPTNPGVHGEIYVRTTTGGAVFDSDSGGTSNGFFGPGTAETNRRLLDQSSFAGSGNPGTLNITDGERGGFFAAVGGTHLTGDLFLGTKVGSPPAGDGVFGSGDRCVFGGVIHWKGA